MLNVCLFLTLILGSLSLFASELPAGFAAMGDYLPENSDWIVGVDKYRKEKSGIKPSYERPLVSIKRTSALH